MRDEVLAGMDGAGIGPFPDPAGAQLQAGLAELDDHFAYAQRTRPDRLTFVQRSISFEWQSLTVNALLGRFLPRFCRATSAVFFALITAIPRQVPGPQVAGQG